MRSPLVLVAATALAAGAAPALGDSLTTSFDGLTNVYEGAGFFDITALNPAGITITGWDVNIGADGFNCPITIYYRLGSYIGAELNPNAWTVLGTFDAEGQGRGYPTYVEAADLFLPAGQVTGIRIGPAPGTCYMTYSREDLYVPVYANGDVRINMGATQAAFFSAPTFSYRAWNGTIYYTVGQAELSGACCVGTICSFGTTTNCSAQSGTFRGADTACATVSCSTSCRADFDASGQVAVPDIFAFLSSWFASEPRADFDSSGQVAVPDIFSFLSSWFAGC